MTYLCYLKLQQNNLFEITQDSPTFFAPPCKPTPILMLPLFARNLNLLRLRAQTPSSHLKREPGHGPEPIHSPYISTSNELKRDRPTERDTGRQSKRVGVYRRHMVWMTVGLSMIEYYNTQAAKCTAMFIVERTTFHYVLCLTLRKLATPIQKHFLSFT